MNIIEAHNLALSPFPDAPAFEFCMQKGEHWRLQGATRSGKTPFIKTLLGLISPRQGSVHLFGEDLHSLAPQSLLKLRRRVGVVFAADGLLPAWSGLENLALPLRYHALYPPAEIEERITNFATRYAIPFDWLNNPVAQLSREKRSALSLARTLLLKPELLIIDGVPLDIIETFSGIRGSQLIADAMAADCSVIISLPAEVGRHLPSILLQRSFKTAIMHAGQLQCTL